MTPHNGRLPAHCPLCGEPTHEILQVRTSGPMAREPLRVGKVLPGVQKVVLLLTSGNTADVRVCAGCAPGVESRLGELWNNICARFAFEHEARPRLGGRPLTAGQMAEAEADLVRTIRDLPLAVVARGQDE